MHEITCDRCGNPSEPFKDPKCDVSIWIPIEVCRARYKSDMIMYTDLCGHCSMELSEFLKPIDPVTRCKQENLPQAGAR